MHDPLSLAFDIKIPWGWNESAKGFRHRNYITLAMIWHRDPEKDGTDDSCGWAYPKLTEKEKKIANDLITNQFDNVKSWFSSARNDEERVYQLSRLFRVFKGKFRPWWQHPRWHIHHWQIRIIPVRDFKRWAFSRCAGCGKRFSWGYAPVTRSWSSDGPAWFKGERDAWHSKCSGRQDVAFDIDSKPMSA